MPQNNAPANQWRERSSAAVDPGVTLAYLTLGGDGRYRLDDAPASADAWFVKDGGRYRLNDASAGAAVIVKSGTNYHLLGS